MNGKDFEKVLSIIKNIEEMVGNVKDYIGNVNILPKNEMIKTIYRDIIEKHYVFREMTIIDQFGLSHNDPLSIERIIEKTISNLKSNPTKKAIYLRVFLNLFSEITENDKEVLIQSLNGLSIEDLEDSMNSLVEVFTLRI